jgi:Undecaprenyl-phosphate glucose phosphotransferase
MEIKYVFILIVLLVIYDLVAINFAFILVYGLVGNSSAPNYILCFLNIVALNLVWLFAALYTKLYHLYSVQNTKTIILKSTKTFALYAIIAIIILVIYKNEADTSPIAYTLFLLAVLVVGRAIIYASNSMHQKLPAFGRKIAIIGCNDTGKSLRSYFMRNKLSFTFTGFFDENDAGSNHNHADPEIIGNFKSIVGYAVENNIKEVYSTKFPEDHTGLSDIFSLAEKNCIKIRFAANFNHTHKHNYHLRYFFDEIHILTQRIDPLDLLRNRIIKRIFDLIFSCLVSVFILSWLVPLLAIIIKLESPGPVFFMQLRSGRNNRPFWCYKFRSMAVNSDSDHKQASKGDARITKTGAFLRKTSIDELPQFFNVMLGNMSVVGPRPHMLKHTDQYKQVVNEYMIRHFIKPGITGWAQVNGYRGETQNELQMIKRVEHDIWYVSNWSVLLDVKTIVLTVLNALRGEKNAY